MVALQGRQGFKLCGKLCGMGRDGAAVWTPTRRGGLCEPLCVLPYSALKDAPGPHCRAPSVQPSPVSPGPLLAPSPLACGSAMVMVLGSMSSAPWNLLT